jgi:hypothetical protein
MINYTNPDEVSNLLVSINHLIVILSGGLLYCD